VSERVYLRLFSDCLHEFVEPLIGNPKFVARCIGCGAIQTCGG